MKTTIAFTLDTEEDGDILRWLARQENKSAAIRAALREHLARGGVTLADVYQAVRELQRMIKAGAAVGVVNDNPGDDWDEPEDAAAALDALANLG